MPTAPRLQLWQPKTSLDIAKYPLGAKSLSPPTCSSAPLRTRVHRGVKLGFPVLRAGCPSPLHWTRPGELRTGGQREPGAGARTRCESGPDPTCLGPWTSLHGPVKITQTEVIQRQAWLATQSLGRRQAPWDQQVGGGGGLVVERWRLSPRSTSTRKTLEKPAERGQGSEAREPQAGPGCVRPEIGLGRWLQ